MPPGMRGGKALRRFCAREVVARRGGWWVCAAGAVGGLKGLFVVAEAGPVVDEGPVGVEGDAVAAPAADTVEVVAVDVCALGPVGMAPPVVLLVLPLGPAGGTVGDTDWPPLEMLCRGGGPEDQELLAGPPRAAKLPALGGT